MQKIIKLNAKNLSLLPKEVAIPAYDRSIIKTGIVHLGIGGFHRSHQAFYTDELMGFSGVSDWAICGVGLMEPDRVMQKRLESQDCLYTLMVNHPDGTFTVRVIGSIIEYLFAPDNPDAVIEKMAHPQTKIVSLTITEGGYNFNQATGEFNFENTDIQWDLKNPRQPRTIFGFLSESLRRRKERGLPGYTVQSCDNIQHNGDVTKRMLLTFTNIKDVNLCKWIETKVSFPNSIVDRITPVTTEANKISLLQGFGINDSCPVICEPYCQWVIEDNFTTSRPAWENAGAQFVSDVSPFEKMKIRLLNAGHSLLGFLGTLHGYSYIHDVVHDQLFAKFLRDFMDKEVTPVLDEVPGINLDTYKDSLFERFGNSQIKDHVARICLQSSAKVPKFLLPTIREQLKAGGPIGRSALVIAAWCRCAEGFDETGNKYPIEDEMKAILQEKALLSRQDHLAFLKIEPIFGDLINSKRFTETYIDALRGLYQKGVITCVKERNVKQLK